MHKLPEEHKRQFMLMAVVGIVSLAVMIAIDAIVQAVWPSEPFDVTDSPGAYIVFFVFGIFFFPGVMRKYREEQHGEKKEKWYHRADFVLCIYGLLSGPFFVFSLWRAWASFMFQHEYVLSNLFPFGGETALFMSIVDIVMGVAWLLLVSWAIYEGAWRRTRKQKDTATS